MFIKMNLGQGFELVKVFAVVSVVTVVFVLRSWFGLNSLRF